MQLSGARMRVFRNPRPQDITVHPDACSGTPELEGTGWVSLLSLNAPDSRWEQWSRMLSATCTFLKRRNWRELCELATGNSSPWRSLKGFCRASPQYQPLPRIGLFV